MGETIIETLGPGDFFGEELAVFGIPSITSLHVSDDAVIYRISPELLSKIPNVRWKLFETFERRTLKEGQAARSNRICLEWNESYSVNVERLDTQHRRLFTAANTLIGAIDSCQDPAEINAILDFLINYTNYHLTEEETLLASYHYEFKDRHAQGHQELIDQILKFKSHLTETPPLSADQVFEFLQGWIANHILQEDLEYSAYLNEKGVF